MFIETSECTAYGGQAVFWNKLVHFYSWIDRLFWPSTAFDPLCTSAHFMCQSDWSLWFWQVLSISASNKHQTVREWTKYKKLEGNFSSTAQGINNQLDLVQCGQSRSIVIWGAVRISLKCEINKGQTECDRKVGRIEMKQKGRDRREA